MSPVFENWLVSTCVVCERLSVMQSLTQWEQNVVKITQNTTPQLLMETIGILVGSELTQNTSPPSELELLMEDLQTRHLSSRRMPPPPKTFVVECGIVCGDYRCIPRGYCLVFSFEPGPIQTRCTFSHLKQTAQTFL